MMKLAVLCCLVALMGCAAASRVDRSLLKGYDFEPDVLVQTDFGSYSTSTDDGVDTDASTYSYSGGYGSSTDGSVDVYGRSSSTAYTEAISEAVAVLSVVLKDADSAPKVYAEAKAKATAFAKAYARAFSRTYVKVDSQGEGARGCASARAVSDAAAKAFGGVFAKAISAIKTKYGYKYVQVSQAYDYAALFAKASTIAQSNVCASGYATATAYQSALGSFVAKAALEAFATSASKSYLGGVTGGSSGSAGVKHDVDDYQYGYASGATITDAPDGTASGNSAGGAKGSSVTLERCIMVPEYAHCCRSHIPKDCGKPEPDMSPRTYKMYDGNYCECL